MFYGGDPKDLPDRNYQTQEDTNFIIGLLIIGVILISISIFRDVKNKKNDR